MTKSASELIREMQAFIDQPTEWMDLKSSPALLQSLEEAAISQRVADALCPPAKVLGHDDQLDALSFGFSLGRYNFNVISPANHAIKTDAV